MIGYFSAASNVTGIVSDTTAISELLHEFGALAFWDFAAAAPYVAIDMGSAADGGPYNDAVFISPHKFIGGPGTPGVLAVRKELFTNRVPAVPGGGTVSYVSPVDHSYLADPAHREEGGTPAIIESIRAGLVFQLQASGRLRGDPPPRGRAPAARHHQSEQAPEHRRSSATSRPSGCRSSRSSSADPTVAICTTTSSSRC